MSPEESITPYSSSIAAAAGGALLDDTNLFDLCNSTRWDVRERMVRRDDNIPFLDRSGLERGGIVIADNVI